jgi:tetratricopeptide (TPR) repeat protein
MKIGRQFSVAAVALAVAAGVFAAGAQARLRGKVKDSAGNPVAGATVTITTPNLSTLKLNLKTDEKGDYATIIADATMPYDIKVEKDGFVPTSMQKKIAVGDTATVDIKLLKPSEAGGAPTGAAAAPAKPSPSEEAVFAYNAAVDMLNSGDKAGAEAKLTEAVGKNPDLAQAWQALSSLAYEKKDYKKAIEAGQKALDLDPEMTNLYPILMASAQATGDKKGAEEWRKKYEEANPDTPETLYNKGIDFYNAGDLKQAREQLVKAVEAKPDFANAHFWLGMTSMSLKDNKAAKEHLQKYLEIDPDGSEAATAKEILGMLK